MKDLPHHIKKLNRQVIRSAKREEAEEEAWEQNNSPYERKQTERQIKKQAKEKMASARRKRPATPRTPEEKNRKMKHRVPIFDKSNQGKQKSGARKTSKKTPRS